MSCVGLTHPLDVCWLYLKEASFVFYHFQIYKGSYIAGVVFIVTEYHEIKRHIKCIYVSTCEAVRQNFELHIHYRTPAVNRLSFHLEYDQCICFK